MLAQLDENNNNRKAAMTIYQPIGQWPRTALFTQVEREIMWDIGKRLPTKREGVFQHVRDMINEAKKQASNNAKYVLTKNFELLWMSVDAPSERTVSKPVKVMRFTQLAVTEGFSYNLHNDNSAFISSIHFNSERLRLYWAVKPRDELVHLMKELTFGTAVNGFTVPVVKDYLTNEGRALLHASSVGNLERVHQLVTANWGDIDLEPDQLIMDGVSECECIPLSVRGHCGHVRIAHYALKMGIFPRETTPITNAMEVYNLALVSLWIRDRRVQKQKYWPRLLVHLKVICDEKGSKIVEKNGFEWFEEFQLFLSDCILGVPPGVITRANNDFKRTFMYRYLTNKGL